MVHCIQIFQSPHHQNMHQTASFKLALQYSKQELITSTKEEALLRIWNSFRDVGIRKCFLAPTVKWNDIGSHLIWLNYLFSFLPVFLWLRLYLFHLFRLFYYCFSLSIFSSLRPPATLQSWLENCQFSKAKSTRQARSNC